MVQRMKEVEQPEELVVKPLRKPQIVEETVHWSRWPEDDSQRGSCNG